MKSEKDNFILPNSTKVAKEIKNVQNNLFIIQAELAGSSMSMTKEKVGEVEMIIDSIEKELPEIKSFFVSGGTELAVYFDIEYFGYPYIPGNEPQIKTFYFRLYSISSEFFNYIHTLNLYNKNYGNPLADPVITYSNITGGYGIFSGAAVSSDSIVWNYNK